MRGVGQETMNDALVLSIFPGIDLLGRAFEEEGYCLVRGPDVIWGGDVHFFHPPSGVFEGVIGGPPCQQFSRLRYLNPLCGQKHGNLIPEFERVVAEAQPEWFLMENVREAPVPVVKGYLVHSLTLNNRWVGGVQHRERRFSFGSRDGRRLDVEVVVFEELESSLAVTSSSDTVPVALGGSGKPKRTMAVMAGHGPIGRTTHKEQITIAEACVLQGLPHDFTGEMPFTAAGKRQVIGNGVPMAMGRAVAKAVRRATQAALA